MALTLNVDGKIIENPGGTDIASAFETLGKGTGLFRGPGFSMIILARREAEEIMATGTHDGGFVLTYQDGSPEYHYNTGMNRPVPVADAIKMFQAYARNEDWGQSKFQWKRFDLEVKTSQSVKRLLIIGFVACLVYFFIRLIAKWP